MPAAKVEDTRAQFGRVFDVYWPLGIAVFIIVVGLIAFVVLRFRSEEPEFPQGVDSRERAEIGYAAFIALIVVFLLVLTFSTMGDIGSAAKGEGGRLEVGVTASKWHWRFEYPRERIAQVGGDRRPPTLVVPRDTPVHFRLGSTDVIHSFWIPERRFKRDAIPQRITNFTLRFPHEGFTAVGGECNQFCGLLHARMDFNVNVLARSEFERWVRER